MFFKSPFPEVSIPEIPLTQFVLERAAALGDKAALIEAPTGRVITYAGLADAIKRVAASLSEMGFRQGDVFGILSTNVPEYAIIFHASQPSAASTRPSIRSTLKTRLLIN